MLQNRSWLFSIFTAAVLIFAHASPALADECERELDSPLIAVEGFKVEQESGSISNLRANLKYCEEIVAEVEARIAKLEKQKRPRASAVETAKLDRLWWIEEMNRWADKLKGVEERAKAPTFTLQMAQAEVAEKIQRTPELGVYLQDAIHYDYLKRLPSESVVSLLWGSPLDKPTEEEIRAVREILSDLSAQGYLILLDGHALITSAVIDAADGRALALVSSPVEGLPPEQTYLISNRYLLAQSFTERYRVVASFNSMLGAALGIYGKVSTFLDESAPEGDSKDFEAFSKWSYSFSSEQFLGVRPIRPPWLLKPKAYGQNRGRFPKVSRPVAPIHRNFRDLDMKELRDFGKSANQMYSGLAKVTGAEGVVFGSGSMADWSSPLIYKIAYEMGKYGVGVATGGSGGAMLAANMGSYDAGGPSLGIPMGGLKSEEKTYSDFHTETVQAQGYSERIPWLLHDRRLIINAPGGNGTVREIVMSLVWLSQEKNSDRVIVFLNKKYYGPLISTLAALSLNPEFLSRIAVVDDTEEFHKAMKNFEAEGRFNLEKSGKLSEPRSQRTGLPEELYKPMSLLKDDFIPATKKKPSSSSSRSPKRTL